jgi:hypothetical protein
MFYGTWLLPLAMMSATMTPYVAILCIQKLWVVEQVNLVTIYKDIHKGILV